MTDRSSTNQQPRPATGTLGREQILVRLQNALEDGLSALPQQIRYVLALSQISAIRPDKTPPPETPLNVTEARYSALVEVAAVLSDKDRQSLLQDIQQIPDAEKRLLLTLRMLNKIPNTDFSKQIPTLWEQAKKLANPAARSTAMYLLASLVILETETAQSETGPAAQLTDAIRLAQTILNTEARVRSLVALSPHLPKSMRNQLMKHILDGVNAASMDNLKSNTIIAMADELPEGLIALALSSAQTIKSPSERVRALTGLARRVTSELRYDVQNEALKAIAAIDNEDERSQALINFAPHLESASADEDFPKLLEQALAIAITMSRRHLRARVLVALAPHLTMDLQGEALAAVHSLSDERERALLLVAMAPTLPPDMLVASLAVAHTMREQDSRVQALTTLAHYAPEHARAQTMLDALAAASNLSHSFEQVTALVQLLDILPTHLLDQAYSNALETTRLIENENARARALSLIGNHLPTEMLDQALEIAYEIENEGQRLSALTGMIVRVDSGQKQDVLDHMLDCARQMTFDYKRARALVSIAPYLEDDMMDKAIEMADELDDPFDKASAYIAIIQNIPREKRPEIVAKAWALVQQIEDGYDQSSALVAIAPFMDDSQRNAIADLASAVIHNIDDDYDRASSISILAPVLAQGDRKVVEETKTLRKYDIVKAGILSALDVPQQTLRTQQLQNGVDLWCSLDVDARFELWKQIAPRLSQLPLADTLAAMGGFIAVFESMIDLKDIALILGVR